MIDFMCMCVLVMYYLYYVYIVGIEGSFVYVMDMESMFSKVGLDEVELDNYWIYLNFVIKDGCVVQIMDDKGEKVIWSVFLEEDERGEEIVG